VRERGREGGKRKEGEEDVPFLRLNETRFLILCVQRYMAYRHKLLLSDLDLRPWLATE